MDGAAVEFGTSGYTKDHIFVLYDRATESIWYPMTDNTLDAVAGSKNGESIDILEEPAPQPLSEWLASYPDSTVLLPSEVDAEMIERFKNAPYLGVQLEDSDAGLQITTVMEETAADSAGMQSGDFFVRIGETEIPNRAALGEAMGELNAGDVVTVVLNRGGEQIEFEVTLGHRPQ